jgi:molybdopterin molybdotransferase
MMVFENVVRRIIFDLKGEKVSFESRKRVDALLESNIFSDPGREEYIRVMLRNENGQLWAVPVLGKSGMISSLSKADGYITVRLNQEGLYQGEKVSVTLFE